MTGKKISLVLDHVVDKSPVRVKSLVVGVVAGAAGHVEVPADAADWVVDQGIDVLGKEAKGILYNPTWRSSHLRLSETEFFLSQNFAY